MGGGGEDEAAIALQDPQPAGQVGGMVLAWREVQPEVGAEERSAQFGDKLFPRIVLIAPAPATEVPVEAAGMRGPMDAFVSQGRVVALRVPEGLEGWRLHVVGVNRVVGARTAMADVCARGGEEGLGAGDPRVGI